MPRTKRSGAPIAEGPHNPSTTAGEGASMPSITGLPPDTTASHPTGNVNPGGVIPDTSPESPPAPPRKRAPARPRAKKAVVVEAVSVLTPEPVPVPVPVAVPAEPVLQFQEARVLLDALVEQSRQARAQLEAVAAERREAWKEVEALRKQMREAQADAAREAEETRQRHLKLLAEANEAHVQLLLHARQGADQVRQAAADTAARLADAGPHFIETLTEETNQLREQAADAGRAIQALPAEVEQVRARLAAALEQARSLEAEGEAARQRREEVERESREAQARLDAIRRDIDREERTARERLETVREEARRAEARLEALRLELADTERRVQYERQKQERLVEAQDARPAESGNRLGATVENGVVVAEVEPGSVAEAAGLAHGDVISAVNGTVVLTGPELRDLVQNKLSGEVLTLRVTRAGVTREMTAHLDELAVNEESPDRDRLGATVEPGVVVAEVESGSAAETAGLARGDVITTVNGDPVLTGPQLRQAVQAMEDAAEVVLRVRRAGQEQEVRTRLGQPVLGPTSPALSGDAVAVIAD